jgi:hypothetical protein
MYVAQVQAQNKHSREVILKAAFAYTNMLKRILSSWAGDTPVSGEVAEIKLMLGGKNGSPKLR